MSDVGAASPSSQNLSNAIANMGNEQTTSFFEQLGELLGEILSILQEEMSEKLEKLVGDVEDGEEIAGSQAEFSTKNQEFSMFAENANTTSTTLGQGLTSIARG